jgi:hypothetical protein
MRGIEKHFDVSGLSLMPDEMQRAAACPSTEDILYDTYEAVV